MVPAHCQPHPLFDMPVVMLWLCFPWMCWAPGHLWPHSSLCVFHWGIFVLFLHQVDHLSLSSDLSCNLKSTDTFTEPLLQLGVPSVPLQGTLQFPLSINHNFNQMTIWVIVYDSLHEARKLLLFSQHQCLLHRRFLINIWWSKRINKNLGQSSVNNQHLSLSYSVSINNPCWRRRVSSQALLAY